MSSEEFRDALTKEKQHIDEDIQDFFGYVREDPKGFLNIRKQVNGEDHLQLDRGGNYLGPRFDEFLGGLEEFILRGGKRFRPSVTLWTYRMFGGSEPRDEIFPAYLATELYHNSTLIHDDIMDQDRLRRGGDTWHVRKSDELGEHADREPERGDGWKLDSLPRLEMVAVGNAIDAGNAMEDLARKTVMETPISVEKSHRMIEILTDTDIRVNSGQNADLEMELLSLQEIAGQELDIDVSEHALDQPRVEGLYDYFSKNFESWTDAYLNMIDRKTGDLYEASIRIGAELADASESYEDLMVGAMRKMSRAFQIQDDYLELEESAERSGKTPTDIINGKLTLASISAYENMNTALNLLDGLEEREEDIYGEVLDEEEASIQELLEQGGDPLNELISDMKVERYLDGLEEQGVPEITSHGREQIQHARHTLLELYGNVEEEDEELDVVRDIILDYSTAKGRARREVEEAKRMLDDAPFHGEYVNRFKGFAEYMLERSH